MYSGATRIPPHFTLTKDTAAEKYIRPLPVKAASAFRNSEEVNNRALCRIGITLFRHPLGKDLDSTHIRIPYGQLNPMKRSP